MDEKLARATMRAAERELPPAERRLRALLRDEAHVVDDPRRPLLVSRLPSGYMAGDYVVVAILRGTPPPCIVVVDPRRQLAHVLTPSGARERWAAAHYGATRARRWRVVARWLASIGASSAAAGDAAGDEGDELEGDINEVTK